MSAGETRSGGLMMRLTPKNWQTFQHYKDRCPPWIKLHRDLLNDRRYMCLPTASKALAPLLWLLASETKEGIFNASYEELEFRLRMPLKEIKTGLEALIGVGFFIVVVADASNVLAGCLQGAIPETETETETEQTSQQSFVDFWNAYPRKVARSDAQKAWSKLKVDSYLLATILRAIEEQKLTADWQKDGGKFIPHPTTWLNGRRWEDEVTTSANAQKPANQFEGAL